MGTTERSLAQRLKEHRYAVKSKDFKSALAYHSILEYEELINQKSAKITGDPNKL